MARTPFSNNIDLAKDPKIVEASGTGIELDITGRGFLIGISSRCDTGTSAEIAKYAITIDGTLAASGSIGMSYVYAGAPPDIVATAAIPFLHRFESSLKVENVGDDAFTIITYIQE